MNENIITENAASIDCSIIIKTILYSGLTAGTLDGLSAIVNAGLHGVGPIRVFQYIASGMLGSSSFEGGYATVVLGVCIHFFIAFCAAAFYYFISVRYPVLIRQSVICGIVYGVVVYIFMVLVVTYLSAASRMNFSFAPVLTGIIIHILFVGSPIAFITSRMAKQRFLQ